MDNIENITDDFSDLDKDIRTLGELAAKRKWYDPIKYLELGTAQLIEIGQYMAMKRGII